MKDQLHSPTQTVLKVGIMYETKNRSIPAKFLSFDSKTEARRKMSKFAMKYFHTGKIPHKVKKISEKKQQQL